MLSTDHLQGVNWRSQVKWARSQPAVKDVQLGFSEVTALAVSTPPLFPERSLPGQVMILGTPCAWWERVGPRRGSKPQSWAQRVGLCWAAGCDSGNRAAGSQVFSPRSMDSSAGPGTPLPKYCSVATTLKAPAWAGAAPPWDLSFTCPLACRAPWLTRHSLLTRYPSVLPFSSLLLAQNGGRQKGSLPVWVEFLELL